MLRSRLLLVSCLAFSTVACTAILGSFDVSSTSSGGPGDNDGGGNEGGGGVLGITPVDARIGILRSQSFKAASDVTWSVQEGDAAGTIDASGKFISSDKPGVVHIVATSKTDPTVTSNVTVTVVPLGINALVGVNGGPGNIDGSAARAHFSGPQGLGYFGDGRQVWIIADTRNQTIRKFDQATGKTVTLAGVAGVKGAADGDAKTARFNDPEDVMIVETGDQIYVADRGNHCIRKVDYNTGATSTFAGSCGPTSLHLDAATGTASRFADFQRVIVGPNKDALYVCEIESGGSNFRGIRRVELSSGKTTTILSSFNQCDVAADYFLKNVYFTNGSDGFIKQFTDTTIANPTVTNAVALPSGESVTYRMVAATGFAQNDLFWVSTNSRSEIHRWHIGNATVDAAAAFGAPNDERQIDGPQSTARLPDVSAMFVSGSFGKIFVADSNAIRAIDLNPNPNTVKTIIGAAGRPDRVDGARNDARFSAPFAVTSDDAGNLYVADARFESILNNTIRKFDPVSGAVSTLAGAAHKADPPLDGPHDQAKFAYPFDIVFAAGKIYVVDILAQAIRSVDVGTGEVKTFAGELGVSGNSNGVGAQAHFKFNSTDGSGVGGGITTDGTNLYVTDSGNFAVRKIVIATGEVTTLAGGTQGSTNGVGTAAQFQNPYGLAFDAGFLYVADNKDETIRRIDVTTGEVTAFMGLSQQKGTVDGDATTATFNGPFRVTADRLGNLYVVELPFDSGGEGAAFTGTIRRIDIKKRTVTQFAGQPGQNGLGSGTLPSTMNCPLSMTMTPKGDLAFADYCDLEIGAIQPL